MGRYACHVSLLALFSRTLADSSQVRIDRRDAEATGFHKGVVGLPGRHGLALPRESPLDLLQAPLIPLAGRRHRRLLLLRTIRRLAGTRKRRAADQEDRLWNVGGPRRKHEPTLTLAQFSASVVGFQYHLQYVRSCAIRDFADVPQPTCPPSTFSSVSFEAPTTCQGTPSSTTSSGFPALLAAPCSRM